MNRKATTPAAIGALKLVEELQLRFASGLDQLEGRKVHQPIPWLRNRGENGGGCRLESRDSKSFNRSSINVSQVHYENDPNKKLGSATALSAIVHPSQPKRPSIHLHISWTEMKSGHGAWRIMADLNPCLTDQDDGGLAEALKAIKPELFEKAAQQGDNYFFIPALQRHRGVFHYYLEQYATDQPEADSCFAQRIAEQAIDTYCDILNKVSDTPDQESSVEQREAQRHYHTLYFFQVLTMDRGTTSGLLIHNENDIGILGSLPSHVDTKLLKSWIPRCHPLQAKLLAELLKLMPTDAVVLVDESLKVQCADAVRRFYGQHPEALKLQAKSPLATQTVERHQSQTTKT